MKRKAKPCRIARDFPILAGFWTLSSHGPWIRNPYWRIFHFEVLSDFLVINFGGMYEVNLEVWSILPRLILPSSPKTRTFLRKPHSIQPPLYHANSYTHRRRRRWRSILRLSPRPRPLNTSLSNLPLKLLRRPFKRFLRQLPKIRILYLHTSPHLREPAASDRFEDKMGLSCCEHESVAGYER